MSCHDVCHVIDVCDLGFEVCPFCSWLNVISLIVCDWLVVNRHRKVLAATHFVLCCGAFIVQAHAKFVFKGTVARDFLASVFFMDLLYMGLIFRG
jgi:hypothetical protein